MDDSEDMRTIGIDAIAHSNHYHPFQKSVIKCLARIEGHMGTVKRMIEKDTGFLGV